MAKETLLSNAGSKFKDWFIKNPGMKVTILLFALLVWFFIILGNQYNYTINTTLEIRNIEEGKTLKEKLPRTIQANFYGKGIDLFYLLISPKSSFKFVLDIENIHWFYDFHLNEYFADNPEKIILPRNVNVNFNRIEYPESIRVELDRLDFVKIPVRYQLDIKTDPGYITVGNPIVIPDSVIVSGPRTYVKKYKEVYIRKFSARNVTAPVETDLDLLISEADNIEVSQRKIHLFQAVEQIGEGIVTNIPVELIGVPAGITVQVAPSEVSLTISAAVSWLKDIQPEDIKIYFDFNKNWRDGESYYIPTIELPPGIISWSEMTPRQIEVRIIRESNY
jgi:hypothetical protein